MTSGAWERTTHAGTYRQRQSLVGPGAEVDLPVWCSLTGRLLIMRCGLQACFRGTDQSSEMLHCRFTNQAMSGRLAEAWKEICKRANVSSITYPLALVLKQEPLIEGITY